MVDEAFVAVECYLGLKFKTDGSMNDVGFRNPSDKKSSHEKCRTDWTEWQGWVEGWRDGARGRATGDQRPRGVDSGPRTHASVPIGLEAVGPGAPELQQQVTALAGARYGRGVVHGVAVHRAAATQCARAPAVGPLANRAAKAPESSLEQVARSSGAVRDLN